VDGVVEAVARPGDLGPLGERDRVREHPTRRDVDEVERRQLGAAAGQAVRHERAVWRRVPPVQRDQRRGVQAVRVDERAVAVTVAHAQDALAGARRAPLVEHPTGDRSRGAEEPDAQQRTEPPAEVLLAGRGIEHRPGPGVLGIGPRAALGTVTLEPAVRIRDLVSVKDLGLIAAERRRCRRQLPHRESLAATRINGSVVGADRLVGRDAAVQPLRFSRPVRFA